MCTYMTTRTSLLHHYLNYHLYVQFNVMSGHRGCPPAPAPPKAPRPTTFGEWIRIMQTAHPVRPFYPPMEMRSMDEEFINLANDIDVCTERFMELQTTMTKDAMLDTCQGCRLVGMDAHMLGRLVHAAIEIGLTIPQVEFLWQRVLDLHFMENVMWEATQEIKPHLYDILQPESLVMVNHVYDNTEASNHNHTTVGPTNTRGEGPSGAPIGGAYN